MISTQSAGGRPGERAIYLKRLSPQGLPLEAGAVRGSQWVEGSSGGALYLMYYISVHTFLS
jgi:hypothetical protein